MELSKSENRNNLEILCKICVENNKLLHEIKEYLDNHENDAVSPARLATNFGIGICSAIVGDRILGL